MRRVRVCACLISGSLFVAASCSSGARQETSVPSPARFGGNWILDRNDSQLHPQMSGGRGSGGRAEGGERGVGFGGGFGGRRGERGGRGGERGGPEGEAGGGSEQGTAMREALRPAGRLQLDLTDSTVMITAGDQASQLLPTDGRKFEETTSDDRKVETRARWKNGSLRVERSVSGAFQVTDLYTLSWSGNRLEDLRTVERSDRPGPAMQLRLIYDRQPADST